MQGFVHVKDLIGLDPTERLSGVAIDIRPITAFSVNDRLDEVLVAMRIQTSMIAVVVDARGGTVGIVTLEDVLESIVGDIIDGV